MRNIYGEGSLYYEKSRKRFVFEGRYMMPDGEKKRKKITAKTRQELKEKVNNWKSKLTGNVLRLDYDLTVEELNKVWLSSVKNSLKPNTFNLYASLMETHVLSKFGKRKINTLQAVEIKYYLNSIYKRPSSNSSALSARTVNAIRNTWRTCMAWAVAQGLIAHNPLDGVRLLREEPKEIKALNQQELNHLLDIAKAGDYYPYGNSDFAFYMKFEAYVAVTLAARTGMRRGEVFGLQWENVDFAKNIIHVAKNLLANRQLASPKTRSSIRNILLDKDTVELLKKWKICQAKFAKDYSGIFEDKKGMVFTSERGTPISLDNFRSRQWKALTEAAGLPGIGFHSLRHTHATLLIAAGIPVKVVSERLGHKDVAMTMRTYVSVLLTMQEQAVALIEKMNKNP
ncbi:tyrosine-type recombinase/integrase [Acidaminococcus fermentans]|uniref:tyrosine-type recombinase/integrase n=1 Tax=Acidaminococcus fermentans TaxID=905 RepID=UPI00241F720E|nr:site-specific integrase [Acidaminococcus fermentans]